MNARESSIILNLVQGDAGQKFKEKRGPMTTSDCVK